MQIELRRVSHNARLSEETECFAADIYIDGKKAGEVKNAGHGGCDDFHPHTLQTILDAYAKTLPVIYEGLDNDAELLVGELLNAHLASKRLARMTKSKLVIVRGGKCYTVGPFKAAGFERDPAVVARHVKAGDLCLNTLPTVEAVKHLRAAHG